MMVFKFLPSTESKTVVHKFNLTNFISVLIDEAVESDDDEELINKVASKEQDSFKHKSSS